MTQAETAWIQKGEPGVDWQQPLPAIVAKAFVAGFRTETLIFRPARPVQDDAQQNAQDDCRKVLAPNGPSVLLWSSTRKV